MYNNIYIIYNSERAYFDFWGRKLHYIMMIVKNASRAQNCLTRVYLYFVFIILERLHHRPVFTEAPHNLTLVLGGSGALACKVLSDLHPYIGWYIGEITVENTENLNLTTMVKVEVRLGNNKIELFG